MDHQPHIGLINTHTEGIGRHHHPTLIIFPTQLPLVLLLAVQSRVEKIG